MNESWCVDQIQQCQDKFVVETFHVNIWMKFDSK